MQSGFLYDNSINSFTFQNQLFRKILSEIQSECQTVWIQIWPNILSGLIWVQNCLQRISADDTTVVGKELTGILARTSLLSELTSLKTHPLISLVELVKSLHAGYFFHAFVVNC